MISILFDRLCEAVNSDTDKIYYHGSKYPDIDQSHSQYVQAGGRTSCLYITPNVSYAWVAGQNAGYRKFYIHSFKFGKPLNIFDARNKAEANELMEYLDEQLEVDWDCKSYVKWMAAGHDWILADEETDAKSQKETTIYAIKQLHGNYDGFVNIENTEKIQPEFKRAPNSEAYGIFNPANLISVDVVDNKTFAENNPQIKGEIAEAREAVKKAVEEYKKEVGDEATADKYWGSKYRVKGKNIIADDQIDYAKELLGK